MRSVILTHSCVLDTIRLTRHITIRSSLFLAFHLLPLFSVLSSIEFDDSSLISHLVRMGKIVRAVRSSDICVVVWCSLLLGTVKHEMSPSCQIRVGHRIVRPITGHRKRKPKMIRRILTIMRIMRMMGRVPVGDEPGDEVPDAEKMPGKITGKEKTKAPSKRVHPNSNISKFL